MEMKLLRMLSVIATLSATTLASPPPSATAVVPPLPAFQLNRVRYQATLAEQQVKVVTHIEFDVIAKGDVSIPFVRGEIAIPAGDTLPSHLRLSREGDLYTLIADRPGRYSADICVFVRIAETAPWHHIRFTGPTGVAITELEARTSGPDTEIQLQSGILRKTIKTTEGITLLASLGADSTVALRWRDKAAETARKSVVTCDTTVSVLLTPTVAKCTTRLRYEILQGSIDRLRVALSPGLILTKIEGDHIRDWQTATEATGRVLIVEFVKPQEKNCALTLYSEQPIEGSPANLSLTPPEPAGVERETGFLTVGAEDVVAETAPGSELRQENAPAGTMAAFRFHQRPLVLPVKLRRIDSELHTADRVSAYLEESRLLVRHAIDFTVDKAGLYTTELGPLDGFAVSDVKGEGIEDWKIVAGKLVIQHSSRVIGTRRVTVNLEKPLKEFPPQIIVTPLRATGALQETAQIGVGSAPGILLRTKELSGTREIPASSLTERQNELLGFSAEQAAWSVTLTSERPASRLVAEIFNLITIRDGLVSGSATIRYAILNQGARQFQVRVPALWKNVDFVGPDIRRTTQEGDLWTVQLQEKTWGSYTLVVTYDFSFDPQRATLAIGGIHAVDAERESGTLAVSTGPSLQLREREAEAAAPSQVFRIDEAEMIPNDRALCTRAILLAYRYSGAAYNVQVDVTRFHQLPILQAVADRTQLTTVLTHEGQLLTQSSFMVKNNEKQFQRFSLPSGATFWGCYVDGAAVKPEQDGDAVLVPLPRAANRDRAFAVEVIYAQKTAALNQRLPSRIALTAPLTDIQNTFAEWEVFVPTAFTLAGFGGDMIVARGTTYGLRDAWQQFTRFYDKVYSFTRDLLVGIIILGAFVILIVLAVRRQWKGVINLIIVVFVLGILGGMLLPALSMARSKARWASSSNNLKQLGLMVKMYANDHADNYPARLEDMAGYGMMDALLIDPASGQRYIYIGDGKSETSPSDTVIAYSPPNPEGRHIVLCVDGHVEWISNEALLEKLARTTSQQGLDASSFEVSGPKPTKDTGSRDTSAIIPKSDLSGKMMGVEVELPTAPVTTAGVRPIRIDVPRTGNRYVFTKVLNLHDKPLTVSAMALKDTVLAVLQGSLALVGFLLGLGLIWRQLRRDEPSRFGVALGLALTTASVMGVLMIARLLGIAMILVPPLILLILVVWAVRRRRSARHCNPPAPPPLPERSAPGVTALGIALLATLLGTWPALGAVSTVTIESAEYVGTVSNRTADIEVTLTLVAPRMGNGSLTLPLFGPSIAPVSFSSSTPHVRLSRSGTGMVLTVDRRGRAVVHLRFITESTGDVTRRTLGFDIPKALFSRLTLTLDESGATVEAPAAVWMTTTKPAGTPAGPTQVEALFGSANRIDLQWTPRIKRAAEMAATVFCENAVLASIGGGTVLMQSRLTYQVAQGEIRELRVAIPAGHRLLRVEGAGMRTWRTTTEGAAVVLAVELQNAVSSNYMLKIETEQALGALPTDLQLRVPQALNVSRENGLIGLQADDELSLNPLHTDGLQKVDTAEFSPSTPGTPSPRLTSAFRFLKPGFVLGLGVAAVRPQIEVTVNNQLRIGQESLSLATRLDYQIKKAGVFSLRLALPANYVVRKVEGNNVAQWNETTMEGRRLLTVRLNKRTLGSYALTINLYQWLKDPPKNVEVTGVIPEDADKLTGYIKIGTELGIQAKVRKTDGLIEIPANTVPDIIGGGALAYKFVQEQPGHPPSWALGLAIEAVEPWIRAEAVNRLTLDPTEAGLAHGLAIIRYEIQNAPVKSFQIQMPPEARNVDIQGGSIRRRDHENNLWRVELQGKVSGTQTLTVRWEQSFDPKTGILTVDGVHGLGTERETGFMTVEANPPLLVTEKTLTGDWVRADTRDVPDWGGQADDSSATVYRYLRTGGALTFAVRRFQNAEVLNAMIERVNLTSVISEDGTLMTRVALTVRNNARQYLEVILPTNSVVWSAFVAGTAVQPTERQGRLLLPLQRSSGKADIVEMELTYVGGTAFPARRGAVTLDTPAWDVPVKDARWDLYLPPDYEYGRFKGTMTYEPEAEKQRPSLYSFTLDEYSKVEGKQVLARKNQINRTLKKAKDGLSQQKLVAANTAFDEIKESGEVVEENQAAVAEIRKELRQAQALNMIDAERNFAYNNKESKEQAETQQGGWKKNEDYAAIQWERVQQAQELGVSKIRPLHVTLPSRGLHYAFTQPLQTESGKPMTVEFRAVNTKGVSLPLGLTLGAAGLLILWIGSVIILGKAKRS